MQNQSLSREMSSETLHGNGGFLLIIFQWNLSQKFPWISHKISCFFHRKDILFQNLYLSLKDWEFSESNFKVKFHIYITFKVMCAQYYILGIWHGILELDYLSIASQNQTYDIRVLHVVTISRYYSGPHLIMWVIKKCKLCNIFY